MKRLLTLTFRVNEQDMFYSYPVQPVHQFILTLNYVDMSCVFVIVKLSLRKVQIKKINYDELFTAKRFRSVRI